MIHIIKEGEIRRVGLNLYRSRGGFVAVWAWYDARTHIMAYHRFRLRMHIKPWIIQSSGRFNVINEYCADRGLMLVPIAIAQDYIPQSALIHECT